MSLKQLFMSLLGHRQRELLRHRVLARQVVAGEPIREKEIELIRGLVNETGAQGVIPLGGALIPSVVDPADLQAITGVPVYNTKSISVRFAEMCVNLGLSHSPLTYPRGKLAYQDFAGKVI